MPDQRSLLVTCEHGGLLVPAEYSAWFQTSHAQRVLKSHRGHDPGAIVAAQLFAEHFQADLICSLTTRLLVDLNRSVDHHQLFSEFVPPRDPSARAAILETHYFPYRNQVYDWVASANARRESVVHLSIHTFVPRIRGEWRKLDVGLLYDPQRSAERHFCQRWKRRLQARMPAIRIRMNQPYAGIDDGLTTWLRTCFDQEEYLGIEVEINQRFFKTMPRRFNLWIEDLICSCPIST